MGMVFRRGKFWAAANDYLFLFDLSDAGRAINRQMLLKDNNKAWNPFGMFVLEWGPDGLALHERRRSCHRHSRPDAPDQSAAAIRALSAHEARRQPHAAADAWLARAVLVRVTIRSASSGCCPTAKATRTDSSASSRRRLPLLQPAGSTATGWPATIRWRRLFELPAGPTRSYALLRRRTSPGSTREPVAGQLGPHGFGGINRASSASCPTSTTTSSARSRSELYRSALPPEPYLLDQDGSLLVADWYGRDDESDMTGRIWR